MHQLLSEEGVANIFANLLGQGLERLLEPDDEAIYAVTDLPQVYLEAVCNNLRIRADTEDAYVVSLAPHHPHHITPNDLLTTIDDEPERPRVVFVPSDCREALDATFPAAYFMPVDTFRNLELMEQQLLQRINQVPVFKRITTLWERHAQAQIPIMRRLDYLIHLVSLCVTADDVGLLYHKLDLIPDRQPDVGAGFADRLSRNMLALTILCDSALPAAARVAALHLTDDALSARLVILLEGLRELNPAAFSHAIFEMENDQPDGLSFDHWHFSDEIGATP